MVTTSVRNTKWGYIIRILQHFATKLWNITNFVMLFQAVMKFCLDLLSSKFWLIGEWSIETAIHICVKYPFNAMFRKKLCSNCNEGQNWMSCTVIIH